MRSHGSLSLNWALMAAGLVDRHRDTQELVYRPTPHRRQHEHLRSSRRVGEAGSHRSGRRLTGMRMLHVGLRVTDLDRSLAFYAALGYAELGRVPDTPFGSLTMLQLPDDPFVSLELVHDPARPVTDTTAVNHIVVQTDDLDATMADLAGRGVPAEPPSDPRSAVERGSWDMSGPCAQVSGSRLASRAGNA